MHPHRVWAEIDLPAIAVNLKTLRRILGDDVRVIGVVKANAYGHGAVTVSRFLVTQNIHMLAVGDSTEAVELREAGITIPILILGAIVDKEIPDVVHHDITPAIHSRGRVEDLERECRHQSRTLNVHLKIDTGMGRLGVMPSVATDLANRIRSSKHLKLTGVYSHLAAATVDDPEVTRKQIQRFRGVLSQLRESGTGGVMHHLANSAGAVRFPQARFDAVRVGALLYGMDPGRIRSSGVSMQAVLRLKSQIIYLKDIPQGQTVGYGNSFRSVRDSRYATMPIGFEDGYSGHYARKGWVLVHGRQARVVGVTMDYTIIDVGHIPDVRVGDEVVLLGRQGEHHAITVEEMAAWSSRSCYEVTCSLGRRVRKVL